MENIYDSTFRKQLFSGGRYRKRLPLLPYIIQFRWSKKIDNPDAPAYVGYTSVNVLFAPFHNDIKASKKAEIYAAKLKYKYIALIELYTALIPRGKLSAIDLRIYLRATYFYSKECKGVMFFPAKNILLNSKQFYELYKKYIDYPFSRKLDKKDYKLIDIKKFFNDTLKK